MCIVHTQVPWEISIVWERLSRRRILHFAISTHFRDKTINKKEQTSRNQKQTS